MGGTGKKWQLHYSVSLLRRLGPHGPARPRKRSIIWRLCVLSRLCGPLRPVTIHPRIIMIQWSQRRLPDGAASSSPPSVIRGPPTVRRHGGRSARLFTRRMTTPAAPKLAPVSDKATDTSLDSFSVTANRSIRRNDDTNICE